MSSITERMLKAVQQKNITFDELAKNIGVNPSNISAWKRRGGEPPARLIPKIAQYLNLSMEYLLTGDKTSKANITVLSEQEKTLLFQFSQLDLEGKTLVKATLLEELRRLKSNC